MVSLTRIRKFAARGTKKSGNLDSRDAQFFSLDALKKLELPIDPPSITEIRSAIKDIQDCWDDAKMSGFVENCRHECLRNITTPFGLGQIVALYDKDGGNITTQYNAEKGIYARPDKEGLNQADYRGYKYQQARKHILETNINNEGFIKDKYTGKLLTPDQVDVDHVISVENMHRSGGWMQSAEKRAERGADERNLVPTSSSLNRSMRNNPIEEWRLKPSTQSPDQSNAERYEVDMRRVRAALVRAEQANKEHSPGLGTKTYYAIERCLSTGLLEAGKFGIQQAMGLLLANLFEAILNEVCDSYHNGFQQGVHAQSFFEAFEKRIKKILEQQQILWDDILDAFKQGAISGFFSNAVTACINIFITTSRRMVRMIREGWRYLTQAFKTLFSNQYASFTEAADAALKILTAGIMTGLGIILEETILKSLEPFLANNPILGDLVPLLTAALTGGVVALCTMIAVYLVDKLDLFGVNRKLRHDFVMEELNAEIEETEKAIDRHLKEADQYLTLFRKLKIQ